MDLTFCTLEKENIPNLYKLFLISTCILEENDSMLH